MKIKAYWYQEPPQNVGDTLTPHILGHFLSKSISEIVTVEYIERITSNKVLAVGSIMRAIQPGDIVWGTGVMRESHKFPEARHCTFLAVRGTLSRKVLLENGASVPEVYGDPALLLPLMYNPAVKKTHKMGLVLHYADEAHLAEIRQKENLIVKYRKLYGDIKIISVNLDWQKFVDEILSCELIVSSSLHGIVIAEAYGISAIWLESGKVCGNGFKFRDYLTGTGRKIQNSGELFSPIENLTIIQTKLINVLEEWYVAAEVTV